MKGLKFRGGSIKINQKLKDDFFFAEINYVSWINFSCKRLSNLSKNYVLSFLFFQTAEDKFSLVVLLTNFVSLSIVKLKTKIIAVRINKQIIA